MTWRLSEIQDRISSFEKLLSVINAMRGISAARVKEATRHVEGIQVFARTIGDAIAQALALIPEGDPREWPDESGARSAVILLAAEHGFAGAFSERVVDALGNFSANDVVLFLIGSRGMQIVEDRGVKVGWFEPMMAHPTNVAPLATRLIDAIYRSLAEQSIKSVSVLHTAAGAEDEFKIVRRQLIPFDYSRFSLPVDRPAPLLNLPPKRLLARLVDEYLFAEISEALVVSHAAESEARMHTMISAHANLSRSLSELSETARHLRHQAITEEIVELVAGSLDVGLVR